MPRSLQTWSSHMSSSIILPPYVRLPYCTPSQHQSPISDLDIRPSRHIRASQPYLSSTRRCAPYRLPFIRISQPRPTPPVHTRLRAPSPEVHRSLRRALHQSQQHALRDVAESTAPFPRGDALAICSRRCPHAISRLQFHCSKHPSVRIRQGGVCDGASRDVTASFAARVVSLALCCLLAIHVGQRAAGGRPSDSHGHCQSGYLTLMPTMSLLTARMSARECVNM